MLTSFNLQVAPMLHTEFRDDWHFGSGEEAQNSFQDGGHLWFSIGTGSAIVDLQVTQMLSTKLRVNWFLCSGEEVQNWFSRWRPSCISISAIFHLQVTRCFLPSFESIGLSIKKKRKIDSITKTCLFKYTETLPPKTENFQIQILICFHISAPKT